MTRPVLWQPSQIILYARKAKGQTIGSLATVDENGYVSNLSFDFLDEGKQYIATIYADAPDAHYKTNPQAYQIRKVVVNKKSKLVQKCAPGGGYAISVIEVSDKAQTKGLKVLK